MIETLANGYSFDSAQQELSTEYQHDRVKINFHNFFVLWDESKLSMRRVNWPMAGRRAAM